MKISRLVPVALATLATISAHAAITLDIQGDLVASSLGNTTGVPDSSVVFIVVDTTGAGFSAPASGTYSANDLWGGSVNEYVVTAFNADGTNSGGEPGSFEHFISSLTLSSIPGWTQGDHLEMYWLSVENYGNAGGGATTIHTGDGFGQYGFASSGGNSTTWVTPGDGFQQSMEFLNPQGSVFGPGPDIATFGAVVPEPATFAIFGGLVTLGVTVLGRMRSKMEVIAK